MSRSSCVLLTASLVVACAPNPPATSVTAPTLTAAAATPGSAVPPSPDTPARPPAADAHLVAAAACDATPDEPHTDHPLAKPAPVGGGNVMAPAFSGGTGFYEIDSAPAPRAAGDSPLELRLSASSASLTTKDPIGLELTFANTGTARITVMHPLDGTLEHMREPNYDLYLRDDATSKVYRYTFVGGRCGNVNAIDKNDYVDLAPGSSRSDLDAPGWAGYLKEAVVAAPGTYSVWLVYRYCAAEPHGLPLGPDVIRKDTLVGVYASNAVTLTVR